MSTIAASAYHKVLLLLTGELIAHFQFRRFADAIEGCQRSLQLWFQGPSHRMQIIGNICYTLTSKNFDVIHEKYMSTCPIHYFGCHFGGLLWILCNLPEGEMAWALGRMIPFFARNADLPFFATLLLVCRCRIIWELREVSRRLWVGSCIVVIYLTAVQSIYPTKETTHHQCFLVPIGRILHHFRG